jgi:hypothetical protein
VKLKTLNAREYIHSNNPAAVALAAKMGYDKRDVARLKLDIFKQLQRIESNEAKRATLMDFADFYVDTTTDLEAGKKVNELAQTEEYQEVTMLFKSWREEGKEKIRRIRGRCKTR